MARRTRDRLIVGAMLTAGALCIVDAFWIGPRWLEVTHHTVRAAVTGPLRIAHVSDLHTHGIGPLEESVLAALRDERPDVILVTGDLVESAAEKPIAEAFLEQLQAPLGVYFSPGNWEHWRLQAKDGRYYDAANVRSLTNESVTLRDDVWLVGIDDTYAGVPRAAKALEAVPDHGAKVAMLHAPIGLPDLAGQVDLVFAGHTHGGQARLPFLGGPARPPGSGPFDAGWYESRGTRMYVSRGIGTSILPVRFLCRPEIAIVDLIPGARSE